MLTSLEGHSIAIADVETIQLAETTSRFAKQLANASKKFSDINLNELTQFMLEDSASGKTRIKKQHTLTL